ncbi:MAG: ABC transporter ATP-binding protein [Pseudomonadota bacterium]
MTTILNVSGLSKAFGGVQAANDVSFTINENEIVAIIGPNGAGKTTVFNMIGGQLAPDRGDVTMLGRSIVGLPPRDIWRRSIARTFQITATFASMTVLENVQMVTISQTEATKKLWRPASEVLPRHAKEALERVGMADQADRPCSELAYGDLKRLELAIALASHPTLLLMDEPTAGMAPKERFGLMDLVASIVEEDGEMAVLFTEHDIDVVFKHASRILVLDRGQIIASGTPDEVRNDARVKEVYLGDMAPKAATA